MDWRERIFLRLLVPIDKFPSKNTVPIYVTAEVFFKVHMLNIYVASYWALYKSEGEVYLSGGIN